MTLENNYTESDASFFSLLQLILVKVGSALSASQDLVWVAGTMKQGQSLQASTANLTEMVLFLGELDLPSQTSTEVFPETRIA